MVKKIVRDILFLGQKSEPATKEDMQIGIDLQDTLKANRAGCVGLAANMIGVKKNVIIVNIGFTDIVMFNPVITKMLISQKLNVLLHRWFSLRLARRRWKNYNIVEIL